MMSASVLIVDDEKNIRMTLSECLESFGFTVDAAETGEEALARIKERSFDVVLLDLRLPGMDGMEALRMIRRLGPDIRVVVITAHGSIESAVEAMKLGARDFVQKPFTPQEIREIVLRAADRERDEESDNAEYVLAVEHAAKCIEEGRLGAAVENLRGAMRLASTRPEAFNLMGAVLELRHDLDGARKHYRAAYSLDPAYGPAMRNIERLTTREKRGPITLWDDRVAPGEKRGR
ncbi:MAG: response regulator [Syntrophobacteraceae bacterium]